MVFSVFCISTDSVISISSRRAGSPAAASAPTTTVSRFWFITWIGDRLTAILMPSGQCAASAQALRNTHSPSGTMSPISSATGMNSAGEIMPRSGCFQRSSASQPVIAVVLDADQRLVMQLEFAFRQGLAQRDFELAPRLHARVHGGLEEAVGAAAIRLGAVERHVGALEQLVRLGAVARRHRNTDAGVDHDGMTGEIVGRARLLRRSAAPAPRCRSAARCRAG